MVERKIRWGVLSTANNSRSLYVWLPSISVPTGHAAGWFFQNPCSRGHAPTGIVIVVVEGDVVVVLVVLVVVLATG